MYVIYSQSFCQKSVERKSAKNIFSYFVLMPDGDTNPCFTSNKLLGYGDITMSWLYMVTIICSYSTNLYNWNVWKKQSFKSIQTKVFLSLSFVIPWLRMLIRFKDLSLLYKLTQSQFTWESIDTLIISVWIFDLYWITM